MTQRLTLPDFDTDGISYGFFGRQGGVSGGVYASLNCRNGSDDDPEAVRESRRRVSAALGVADIVLHNAYQVHSADVVVVRDGWSEGYERPQADALVTDRPGVAVGVLTADCTPVLFHGRKVDGSLVVAAAHAGWRGAVGGVLENTLLEMTNLGAGAISAAIGPCIAQASYEVSQEFYEVFMSEDRGNVAFFEDGAKAFHYQFDLPRYCEARLRAAGVQSVVQSGVDTYANEDDYFSYRRTTHRGEPDYGGQISVVMIKTGTH